MGSPARKRILFSLVLLLVLLLLIRYIIYNGTIMAPSQSYVRDPKAPVVVSVYYEALCPDSKHFIIKQLVPAFQRVAKIMDVILVPYGKAQTYTNQDGTFRFDCQHGPVECQANTYHACAIEIIEDPHKRLDVISCMIKDNRLPKEALNKCSKQHGVEKADLIQKCFDSPRGGELLKLNGDATHALRPSVTFIPTITLDGSQGRQAAILKNIFGEICKIAGTHEDVERNCHEYL